MKAAQKRWEAWLWPPKSGPLWQRAALFPLEGLSYIYGSVMKARTRSYLAGGKSRFRSSAYVIVAGNLTVGGTGKTTLAAWIAAMIEERGYKPAVILRGYKRSQKGGPHVVSEGNGPCMDAASAGDEAYLLALKLCCPVIVACDRVKGAAMAENLGCTHLVLDDGYQHLSLERDLDILVLDSTADPADRFLLPRGPLREPISAAGRAGVLVFSRCENVKTPQWEWLSSVCPETPRFAMRYRQAGLFDAQTGEELPLDEPSIAFSGIGTPASFKRVLGQAGVNLVRRLDYPDHHYYSGRDLAKLTALAKETGATRLVTTEKDAVKIDPARLAGVRLAVLKIEPDFMGDENELMNTILERKAPG
ncbi:MAG: tetraacyldisaccharide 4'-kinase [bacterium]